MKPEKKNKQRKKRCRPVLAFQTRDLDKLEAP